MSIIMLTDGVIVIYNNDIDENVKLYWWYDLFGGTKINHQNGATIVTLECIFKVISRCFN